MRTTMQKAWQSHRCFPRIGGSLLILMAALTGCGESTTPGTPKEAGQASAQTRSENERVAKSYPLNDMQATADAARGLIAVPTGKILDANGKVLWDFDAFSFIKGPSPDTVNPSLWRQAMLNNHIGLFKVTDGIYQLRGFDISNISLIEGKTGWIVVDALTSRETASAAMAFARRYLGDKKVSALIFTHSHIDHFGGAQGVISPQEVATRKVLVVAPEGFMNEATSENVMAGIAMGRRASYMYGKNLDRSPKGLIDTGLGKAVAMGSIGILPPSLTISGPDQNMLIDGVRFEFHNAAGSEAPAEMGFYLPDYKAYCGAEIAVQTMHNLYTLRGAKVRDAMKWSQYLDQMIITSAPADVYFSQHHWPVWGHGNIANFLSKQRDIIQYTHDQTVRMMNAGKTPREIAEEIRLPKSLDDFIAAHGYYGTLRHNAKAVYQYYLGWYDSNPANLNPLPPQEAAKHYIELAGGIDKALAVAQSAFDKGDYRWAAELLNHIVFAAPDHGKAKELLARTYDQMGYVAESAPWRNEYLSAAHELRQSTPKEALTSAALVDMLAYTPTDRFLEAMAASLNGPKAEGVTLKINLVFSDNHESYVLDLDNSVLHHHATTPANDANATLTLTKPLFIKMLAGTAGVKDVLFGNDIQISGSKIDLIRFFSLIDKAKGNFAIVTPS